MRSTHHGHLLPFRCWLSFHQALIWSLFFVAVTFLRFTIAPPAEGMLDDGARACTSHSPLQRAFRDLDPSTLQNSSQHRAMMDQCPIGRRLTIANHTNLTTFVDAVFDGLNQVPVGSKPIVYIGEHFKELVHTRGVLTEGFWAEFGVYRGTSLIAAYNQVLSTFRGVMAGFDSFQGLPSKWRPGFDQGFFSTPYQAIRNRVPSAVELYQGWFQDTIPSFKEKHPSLPASLIHHDGDLFVSTAITLSLLADRIVPGTLMCFDELVGYPDYRQHEILALYLWMQEYRATLCPVAVSHYFTIDQRATQSDLKADRQSACFQVLSFDN